MSKTVKFAKIRTSRVLVSTAWLIPLAAVIVGAYLLIQSIRDAGPEITLLMDYAEGIEVNQTRIRVLNVDVGRVIKIRLRPDQKGVELTAKLNRDAEELMREDTQFWVVKPRIDGTGVSGLATLVSGAYIAFSPGSADEKADRFVVAELPPITAIGQNGLRLSLRGENKSMVSAGSPVLFDGHEVGRVESARFNPTEQTVEYSIFIDAPNDALVNSNSEFWLDSGVRVQTDSNGISVQTPSLSALISGAISFRTPTYRNETAKPAQNGDRFQIYANRAEVDLLPGSRTLYFVVFFKQSIRGLTAGAPVEYKGMNIGSVADVPYFQNNDALKLFQRGWVPVRLRIDPYKLEQNAHQQSKEYWQNQLEKAFNQGLAATLSSNNLILGSKMIELSDIQAASADFKPMNHYAGLKVIASRSGGLDDLQVQLSKLLDKFNALPLEQTVSGVNGSLNELQKTLQTAQTTLNSAETLLSNEESNQLPQTINQTLRELQETLRGVSPQSPVYRDIQRILMQLDDTLNEVRPLVQNLKEQPNALIFESKDKDPIPKGTK